MLDIVRFGELEKIADKASEQMEELKMEELKISDYKFDFIGWDEEHYAWLVKFYVDRSDNNFTGVYVGYGMDGNYMIESYFSE